jgi:hypothetical protein
VRTASVPAWFETVPGFLENYHYWYLFSIVSGVIKYFLMGEACGTRWKK